MCIPELSISNGKSDKENITLLDWHGHHPRW